MPKTCVVILHPSDGASVPVMCEIAETPEERIRGLTWRARLPWGKGMLFWSDTDVREGYWMRDTFVPLSIAFIDSNGIIVEMANMMPLDETNHGSKVHRWALEVPMGFFDHVGVTTGDVISMIL